jgi:hypothetical protein
MLIRHDYIWYISYTILPVVAAGGDGQSLHRRYLEGYRSDQPGVSALVVHGIDWGFQKLGLMTAIRVPPGALYTLIIPSL